MIMHFTLNMYVLSSLGYKYEFNDEFWDEIVSEQLSPITGYLNNINHKVEKVEYDNIEDLLEEVEFIRGLITPVIENFNRNENNDFYLSIDDIIPVLIDDAGIVHISVEKWYREYDDNGEVLESLKNNINNNINNINKLSPRKENNIIILYLNIITRNEPIAVIDYNPFTNDLKYLYMPDDDDYDDDDEY